ncbi:Crp/Fnr family transcriptional regulator [Flavobacterium sp. W1B]|uniref:Crp/Fnr family transcriptional regulator n=1 Tax=Flavobacterium sp. W1B TaxID=3394146 RepID=UPI0039BD7582
MSLNKPRNEIVVDFNDVCDSYYFINKGCIRLYTINNEGIETSRYFAFEGMLCTALPSFIDQQPTYEYLQTIEKSELLVISRKDFYDPVERFPEFDKIYKRILELGFISAQKRIYGFQGFNALEKVKWVIKHQPHFLLRVSNKMAASYLGISPSTLSRIKSKL